MDKVMLKQHLYQAEDFIDARHQRLMLRIVRAWLKERHRAVASSPGPSCFCRRITLRFREPRGYTTEKQRLALRAIVVSLEREM
jgi:hypothetical protein